MNIDERLHALTQSVKLMAAMHRDTELQFQKQFLQVQNQFSQHEQLFGQIALRLHEVAENIDRLARIAGVPQNRLDAHERKWKDLEQGPRGGSRHSTRRSGSSSRRARETRTG